MTASFRLLSAEDPPVYRVFEGSPSSPYVLMADHAGRAIPRSLGSLGLSAAELDRHIAWDIGIAGVSELLAPRLEAFLILQTYSRLVIDCNRPLDSPTSIAEQSEYTVVPGNQGLSAEEKRARAHEIFEPYHARIESELARRAAVGQPTILISMHSFAPRFRGVDRPWHCGVLYHRDSRLAKQLLGLLQEQGLTVGDNQPYFVSDTSDYGIPRYGEQLGNLHVELEIRQDLIATVAQQREWAERLARVLPRAIEPFKAAGA
jgi:predicted N-formylglutamate amidohydrolase